MKLIVRYVRRHIGMFLLGILFLSLETFAELLQPTFMAGIVDNGVANLDVAAILRYGAVMLAITAVGAVGAVARNIFASRTSQTIGKELRGDLYKKTQTLSHENIDRLQTSSIITRITNDVTQIQTFVNGLMRIMMKVPIMCVGAVTLLIIQTPSQLPIMCVILLVSGVLIAANMKLGYPRYGQLQKRLDRLNEVSREFLSNVRVVKAFNAEERESAKFGDAAESFASAGVSAARVLAVFGPLINLAVNFGIIALLWLSKAQNSAEIGRLMASVNYMTQVLFSLGMVSNILNNAVRATTSAARVSEILDEVPKLTEPSAATAVTADISGEITFSNVTFTYAGAARPAISGVDFTVKAGETLGIIGATGSGKSTLVNLIPRFYDPTVGCVEIDGQDVRKLATDNLRGAIAVVPQKSLLFTGTIADNLRWGDENADEAAIHAAAKTACADDFVRSFPLGYDTVLGQGGVNLSGGQKQRLSIARALVRKPKILILDDCTSALDATTEARVLGGLGSGAQGATVLLISQRISTVMRCDRVLCMENGLVAGIGAHDELLASCPTYRAVYASQIGGEAV
ncbi:MAG: ABC transporter ATP-binding protein/permease [Oscillospiraceae bacterium]|jgi:ATP-binding cassette subfamily B protein|nr:ABC transporter ATP-binding protein/permease [Oscillospiraceae bacterium]